MHHPSISVLELPALFVHLLLPFPDKLFASDFVRCANRAQNDFERASVDTFFLEAPDLGQLVAVEIGHDDRGMGSGWHLNKVVVVNEHTGASECFAAGRDGAPGGRWFASDEDDKATWRVLPALQSSEVVYT